MTFDVSPPDAGWAAPLTPSIVDLHSFPGREAKLIHLLMGATNVVHGASGTVVVQRTNWAVLGTSPAKRSKSGFAAALNAQVLGVPELNAYLARNLAQRVFFEELFDEFARYFHHSKNGIHVLAFLHLYRILERISYAFPIAYAAKSHDYKGTYAQLRAYLTSPKDGELKFFNGFVAHLLPVNTLNGTVRFDVSSNDPAVRPAHFQTLVSTLSPNHIPNQSVGLWIETSYRHVLDVLINLRNRYFHFMSGVPNNITGSDLPEPDEFFGSLNPVFLNWLTHIYFRLLEARL